MSGDSAAAQLAAQLQRYECASWRGMQLTGHAHHAGSNKAYAHALQLLLQHFPGALQAAVHALDEDVDAIARADYRQALAAKFVQRTAEPAHQHLGLPAVDQLGHGVVTAPVIAPQGDQAPALVPPHHKA